MGVYGWQIVGVVKCLGWWESAVEGSGDSGRLGVVEVYGMGV